MRSDPRGDVDGSPRRLWIEFEPVARVSQRDGIKPIVLIGDPVPLAFGVTGLDSADCWNLVSEAMTFAAVLPIRTIVWDIDVSSLDVYPTTIGNPAARGVWYRGAHAGGRRVA